MTDKSLLEHLAHKTAQHGYWWRFEEVIREHVLVEHVRLFAEDLDLLNKGIVYDNNAESSWVNLWLRDGEFLNDFFLFLNLEQCFYVVKHQVKEKIVERS